MSKNPIRQAVDNRLQTMEWHGQKSVLRKARADKPVAPRLTLRLAGALCALAVLAGATALAARSLLFSPRETARMQAHTLLCQQYGFSEETLALFDESLSEEGGAWVITLTLPIYAEQAGVYTVTGGKGAAHVQWSHDGEPVSPDAPLSADIWGAAQVERMRLLYHEHAEALAAAEARGYDSLSIEEKAAIDAPLRELPYIVGAVNVLPAQGDLTLEEALDEARGIYALERGLSPSAAAGISAVVSLQSDGGEPYYDIRFTEADSGFFRILLSAAVADTETGLRVGTLLRIEEPERVLYDKAEGVNVIPGPDACADIDAMTHAERAAYAAEQIALGGDLLEWNYLLPSEGDIAEEEAAALAKEAIAAQLELTETALDSMVLQTRFLLDYGLGEEPIRVWQVRFVDSINDYQVTLRAEDGRVERVHLMDGALAAG